MRFATHTSELALNPSARTAREYGPEQERILSAEGLRSVRETVCAWPDYRPTPLIALSGLADAAGVESLHYKDEAHRFGLKSFKPLGGAYAVARLLLRELPKTVGAAEVTIADLLGGRYRQAASRNTVTAATDGNHGRSVAWGAGMFGCRFVIFINQAVSERRERSIASYGAEVRRNPGSIDDAVRTARATAEAEGWHVVPDTSSDITMQAPRDVTQGYALMAAESIEQLPYVAAALAVEARRLGEAMGGDQVATVGVTRLTPDLINVIARKAVVTLDLRNTDDGLLENAEDRISEFLTAIADREGVEIESRVLARFAPVVFDPEMVDLVETTAADLGFSVRRLPSGAGHDAQMFAPNCPTAMVFVPSKGGISHNVEEFTSRSDIAAGANVLFQAMLAKAS